MVTVTALGTGVYVVLRIQTRHDVKSDLGPLGVVRNASMMTATMTM